jgi:hypothetical protein
MKFKKRKAPRIYLDLVKTVQEFAEKIGANKTADDCKLIALEAIVFVRRKLEDIPDAKAQAKQKDSV